MALLQLPCMKMPSPDLILAYVQDMANPDLTPKDVDREYVLSFMITDEHASFLLRQNLASAFPSMPTLQFSSLVGSYASFANSESFHNINGEPSLQALYNPSLLSHIQLKRYLSQYDLIGPGFASVASLGSEGSCSRPASGREVFAMRSASNLMSQPWTVQGTCSATAQPSMRLLERKSGSTSSAWALKQVRMTTLSAHTPPSF